MVFFSLDPCVAELRFIYPACCFCATSSVVKMKYFYDEFTSESFYEFNIFLLDDGIPTPSNTPFEGNKKRHNVKRSE